jgi:hypothetical protein
MGLDVTIVDMETNGQEVDVFVFLRVGLRTYFENKIYCL